MGTNRIKKIRPKKKLFSVNILQLWQYKDLVWMFIYRDFVTYYKQTVLGPTWFFIQPLFTATMNFFIFGKLAGLGPAGTPGFLFYLSGPILWQYFQETFLKTSGTFVENQMIFGKVYFPRLVMPVATVLSGLMKFGVQLALLLILLSYHALKTGDFLIRWQIVYFPIILLIVMVFALGIGLVITSLTTKYRDLKMLIDFAVPIAKYMTPGIATTYFIMLDSMSEKWHWVIKFNPLGHLIDSFNFMFLGAGGFSWLHLGYSGGVAILMLFVGVLVFNQVEKNFMDTV